MYILGSGRNYVPLRFNDPPTPNVYHAPPEDAVLVSQTVGKYALAYALKWFALRHGGRIHRRGNELPLFSGFGPYPIGYFIEIQNTIIGELKIYCQLTLGDGAKNTPFPIFLRRKVTSADVTDLFELRLEDHVTSAVDEAPLAVALDRCHFARRDKSPGEIQRSER